MGWQNMRAISDKLARIDLFHKIGIRVMQLTYNNRNFIGDGCLEKHDGGLLLLVNKVVERMNGVGVAIDVSHVGGRTALQAAKSQPQAMDACECECGARVCRATRATS